VVSKLKNMTMKNVLLVTFLLYSSFMISQDGLIVPPEIVKLAFEKGYPEKKAVWSIEYGSKVDDIRFEAKFTTNTQTKGFAQFDQNGIFKFYKEQISASKLPNNVKLYLDKNYPLNKVRTKVKSKAIIPARVVFCVTDARNVLKYEAYVKEDLKNYKAIFDEEGNYINRIQIK
jgi:hypothetical protein